MDYNNKQTSEIWHDLTIEFSRRKSYLNNNMFI